MNRKRLLLAVAIVSGVLLWLISAGIYLVIVRPRLEARNSTPPPAELAYCDVNPGALCVVSFGADQNDRMLINFILPFPTHPLFYVQVQHAGMTGEYDCRVVEDFPGSAYCSGPRVPLGEAIVIEVFSARQDALLARGIFVVSAIGLPTPVSVLQTPTIWTTVPPAEPEDSPTPFRSPTGVTPASTTPASTTPASPTPARATPARATPTSESYP
jgi:hypothetical protein